MKSEITLSFDRLISSVQVAPGELHNARQSQREGKKKLGTLLHNFSITAIFFFLPCTEKLKASVKMSFLHFVVVVGRCSLGGPSAGSPIH